MERIFYLSTLTKIGDTLSINGFNVVVTNEIVKANPTKFKVEKIESVRCINPGTSPFTAGKVYPVIIAGDRSYIRNDRGESSYTDSPYFQSALFSFLNKAESSGASLLQQAKIKFPPGTRVQTNYCNEIFTVATKPGSIVGTGANTLDGIYYGTPENILAISDSNMRGYFLYKDGTWAKALPSEIITTREGVKMFEGDKVWVISTEDYSYDKFPVDKNFARDWQGNKWLFFNTEKEMIKWRDDNQVLTTTADNVTIRRGNIFYKVDSTFRISLIEKATPENIKGGTLYKLLANAEKYRNSNQALFTTSEGVKVYFNDKVWYIDKRDKDGYVFSLNVMYWRPTEHIITFSSLRNAEEWVDKNTLKNLVYFESMLLDSEDEGVEDITEGEIWEWISEYQPKIYWTKVLQLIANYYNREEVDFSKYKGTKYFITKNNLGEFQIMKHDIVNYGLVYFKSAVDALKASEIIGENFDEII
jgi:hypothetical protein